MDLDCDEISRAAGDEASGTSSEIFDVLWRTLVEILGTPATATLVRRSVKRQLERFPELAGLTVTRTGFDYDYVVPENWKHANKQADASLHALVQDLYSLLLEMTGSVVLHRLKALPQLAKCGLSPLEDK